MHIWNIQINVTTMFPYPEHPPAAPHQRSISQPAPCPRGWERFLPSHQPRGAATGCRPASAPGPSAGRAPPEAAGTPPDAPSPTPCCALQPTGESGGQAEQSEIESLVHAFFHMLNGLLKHSSFWFSSIETSLSSATSAEKYKIDCTRMTHILRPHWQSISFGKWNLSYLVELPKLYNVLLFYRNSLKR